MNLNLPKTSRPNRLPATTRSNPIGSNGPIIRDGPGTVMRKTPDFEQVLKNMNENRATITLPDRYTFIPAQSIAYGDLIRQHQFSSPSFTPDMALSMGPQGRPGVDGRQGGQGDQGMQGKQCGQRDQGEQGNDGKPGEDGKRFRKALPQPPAKPEVKSEQAASSGPGNQRSGVPWCGVWLLRGFVFGSYPGTASTLLGSSFLFPPCSHRPPTRLPSVRYVS